MGTLLILAALLSICSLSFSQECRQQFLEDIDFPGTDIKSVFSPDVNHCQQICTQHPSCLFFTFIRADWTTDNRHFVWRKEGSCFVSCWHFFCYLKTTDSGQPNVQTPLQGVTSGYSLKPCNPDTQPCLPDLYHDVDFLGSDYTSLFTGDHEECRRTCTRDPGCQFFTFVNGVFSTETIRYKCHLKFSWAVPTLPIVEKKAGVVSGFSHVLPITQGFIPACEGKLLPGLDIPGNDFTSLPSPSAGHCQALCTGHPDCTYFSFDSDNLKCYLKNNKNELVTKAKSGIISGLPARLCEVDNSWVKVAHEGVDFRGSDIRFELTDDPDSCQRKCTEDPNCQFYTYVNNNFSDRVYRRRCYLKRAVVMPAPEKVVKTDNLVSGFQLRDCV